MQFFLRPVTRHVALFAVLREPSLDADRFDRCREGFVESRVILDVQDLVRQFMEQRGHESYVVPPHHRIQDRVGEVAERRIGRNAPDRHIESLAPEPVSLLLRGGFGKIAAVTDAADDGIAPLVRPERKFRGREHVPDHEVALEVGIGPVALVVRQSQFVDRELPCCLYQLQPATQVSLRLRACKDLVDRLALA